MIIIIIRIFILCEIIMIKSMKVKLMMNDDNKKKNSKINDYFDGCIDDEISIKNNQTRSQT